MLKLYKHKVPSSRNMKNESKHPSTPCNYAKGPFGRRVALVSIRKPAATNDLKAYLADCHRNARRLIAIRAKNGEEQSKVMLARRRKELPNLAEIIPLTVLPSTYGPTKRHREFTPSRPIREVKLDWAQLVLG